MPTTVVAPRKSLEPWIFDSVEYYPHQIIGVRKLSRMRNFILGDDMGLGKSLQSLTIFAIDVFLGKCERALVVCPTTLKGNWDDEIGKFTSFQKRVLSGTPASRSEQITDFRNWIGPRILIVNYEQVKPHLAELNACDFDVVIFDEAHYLKNHSAIRTKSCMRLRSKRKFMLTGTPMLNRVNELWTLLHLCSPAEFPNYHNFVNRFCRFGGYKNKEIIGTKNLDELRNILDRYMLQRHKKDVLDLPDVQVIERHVDLLPQQLEIYKEISNELKAELVGKDGPQDIENGLTKQLRLLQVCGTTVVFNGEDHSSKLDLAIADSHELLSRGEKIVVFTRFRPMLAAFAQRLDGSQYPVFQIHGDVPIDSRSEVVKTWGTQPGAAVLVCNTTVAGVGLNMTASRYVLFLDKLYTPGLNKQAIDRLHRIGADKTQPIQVLDYIVRNTVEARVAKILSLKTRLNKDVLGDGDGGKFRRMIYEAMMEDINAEH